MSMLVRLHTGATHKQLPARTDSVKDATPLERRTVTAWCSRTHTEITDNALSACWLPQPPPVYVPYISPVSADRDTWTRAMQLLDNDLSGLLCQPCHIFWSHLIHDADLVQCLHTTLHTLPRAFEPPHTLSYALDSRRPHSSDHTVDQHALNVRQLTASICLNLLRILLRSATARESATDYISDQHYAAILASTALWTPLTVLELCALYGSDNTQLVGEAVSTVISARAVTRDQLCSLLSGLASRLLPALSSQAADTLHCSADVTHTLHMFAACWPHATRLYHECGVVAPLVCLYERALDSAVARAVIAPASHRSQFSSSEQEEAEMRLDDERVCLSVLRNSIIALFRRVLTVLCLSEYAPQEEVVGDSTVTSSASGGEALDVFVMLLSECASEQQFMCDYTHIYPLACDIQRIAECTPGGIDSQTYSYLTSIVASFEQPAADIRTGAATNGDWGDCSDSKLCAMIANIQQMLPNVATSTVRDCIRRHDYDLDRAVCALIEQGGACSDTEAGGAVGCLVEPSGHQEEPVSGVSGNSGAFGGEQLTPAESGRNSPLDSTPCADAGSGRSDDGIVPEGGEKVVGCDTLYDDEYDDAFDEVTVSASGIEQLQTDLERLHVTQSAGGPCGASGRQATRDKGSATQGKRAERVMTQAHVTTQATQDRAGRARDVPCGGGRREYSEQKQRTAYERRRKTQHKSDVAKRGHDRKRRMF